MWLFTGLLAGIGLLLLAFWLRRRNIAIAWYEWLIALIGLVLLVFGIQNYIASSAGGEPTAPGIFLLLFALPGIILLAIAVAFAWLGYIRKKNITSLSK